MLRVKTDMIGDTQYGSAPSVLVASDTSLGASMVEAALACLDARILAVVPIDEARERLAQTVSVSAVVIHADSASSEEQLGGLLGDLDVMTADGACRAVVIVPPHMIDAVFARIGNGDIEVLSQPDQGDIIAALALACLRRPFRLNDVFGDTSDSRLVQLSEEVGRIARALASLAEKAPPPVARLDEGAFATSAPMTADVAAAEGTRVRALIRARRMRDQFFRSELFADPAWDMLLDLMAARLEHKRVSVSSLCIAAAVPVTTALRWIKSMTDEGLFVRQADHSDGRRIFIELSEPAAAAMSAYLEWIRMNPI